MLADVRNKLLHSSVSTALTVLLVLLMLLSGCSKNPADVIVGEYQGTSNSYLKLNQDGTCIYSEPDKTGSGTGTWALENNILSVKVTNLNYVLYADITEDPDGFILESQSENWNDEYFKKTE